MQQTNSGQSPLQALLVVSSKKRKAKKERDGKPHSTTSKINPKAVFIKQDLTKHSVRKADKQLLPSGSVQHASDLTINAQAAH